MAVVESINAQRMGDLEPVTAAGKETAAGARMREMRKPEQESAGKVKDHSEGGRQQPSDATDLLLQQLSCK